MKRPSGFTLVELVLSFGIIAVALLSLVAVFLSGFRLMQQSDEYAAAAQLARSQMESVKAFERTLLPTETSTFDESKVLSVGEGDFPPPPFAQARQNPYEHTLKLTLSPIDAQVTSVVVEVQQQNETKLTLQTYLFR